MAPLNNGDAPMSLRTEPPLDRDEGKGALPPHPGSTGGVSATPAARQLLAEIVAEHGPVMFHQSGGCCDGSSPMCYPKGEFLLGDHDVKLGEIDGASVYIGGAQAAAWAGSDLIIDAVPGRGGMFSLDNGRERRFLTRSKVCRSR
jgi:uncharacterized protein (DUF779 family)